MRTFATTRTHAEPTRRDRTRDTARSTTLATPTRTAVQQILGRPQLKAIVGEARDSCVANEDMVAERGQPLSSSLRGYFGPRLGHDLSRVRLHEGGEAHRAARSLGAEAFTVGQDIFLARDAPRTDTLNGRRLLAHELIHTVQQRSSTGPSEFTWLSDRHDPAEREASIGSQHVAVGRASPVLTRAPSIGLARQETGETESQETARSEEAGSKWPWYYLIDPLILQLREGSGPGLFYQRQMDDLAWRQLNAGVNLWWSGVWSHIHGTDFMEELEKTELITGHGDTIWNAVSFLFPFEPKKFLEEWMVSALEDHPAWVVLYGIPFMALVTLAGYKNSGTLNFTTILGAALEKFTESPQAFSRAFQQWGRYQSFKPSEGISIEVNPESGGFKIEGALNLASFRQYPDDEEKKKSYIGPEVKLHFSVAHDLNLEMAGEFDRSYSGGVVAGTDRVHGFADIGLLLNQDAGFRESYQRFGAMIRQLGPFAHTQFSLERLRTENGPSRYRLNVVGETKLLETTDWSFLLGARLGVLIPKGGGAGAVDWAATAAVRYKPLDLGAHITLSRQLENLFQEQSGSAFGARGHIVWKLLSLSIDYANRHRSHGETHEVRFFINFGPGQFERQIAKPMAVFDK